MSATHCPKCGRPYELNRGHTCQNRPKLVVDCSPKLPIREACEVIYYMIRADDAEPWERAERFLKEHAPDLYNRIGMDKPHGAE